MMPKVFWEYVLSPNRSGVVTALDFILRDNKKISVFQQLTAAQRDTLRLHLATSEPIQQLNGKKIKSLTVFFGRK